jgi:polysaccharide export outer membrane protein
VCAVAAFFFFGVSQTCAQDNLTVGQTPQQANDRIKSLSTEARSAPSPHDYRIGNGDLLDVAVFDVPELSKELRVNTNGTINIPLVPVRLHVAGLTEIQAEEKIAEVLEANGLVSHPEVGVSVKEHRSRPITVVGAVSHAMVYQADRDVTLLEVLAEAGGILNDAGDTVIITRRPASHFTEITTPQPVTGSPAPGTGEPPELAPENAPPATENSAVPAKSETAFPSAENMPEATAPAGATATEDAGSSNPSADATSITVNLNELLEKGDMQNNIPLQGGDVVTVPHAGIVYVLGAVTRPGGFVLANDRTQLTTLKILSLAGGLTRFAKMDQAVIIRKDQSGKQTENTVDLKKVIHRQAEDVTMRASDILYIPDDRTKEVLVKAAEIAVGIATAVTVFRLANQ